MTGAAATAVANVVGEDLATRDGTADVTESQIGLGDRATIGVGLVLGAVVWGDIDNSNSTCSYFW